MSSCTETVGSLWLRPGIWWSNRSLSSILSLNRCLHFSTRMFYRTAVLYTLYSWFRMHPLYSILFTSLGHISFFVYGLLFPKDKIISFYQFHVLYKNFGDMNTVCQLCCFNRYLYVIHLWVFFILVSVCVCVPLYILLRVYELYVCIYSRTLAVPTNVYCWIWPDFK